jgi:hypothetical protein
MEFKTPNVNDLILQNKQLVELLEQTNHVIIKKINDIVNQINEYEDTFDKRFFVVLEKINNMNKNKEKINNMNKNKEIIHNNDSKKKRFENAGKKWTSDDKTSLFNLFEQKYDSYKNVDKIIFELSCIFKRSEWSIWCRLYTIGIDIHRLKLYTKEKYRMERRLNTYNVQQLYKYQEERILSLFNKDMEIDEIATEFNYDLVIKFLESKDLIEFED